MTTPKKILLICYYFPPLGGAGVGRPLALYKNLPEYNIDCDVLTVKPVAYRFYEQEQFEDDNLGTIYRAGSTDPQRIMYLLGMRQVKDKIITQSKSISDRYFPDPKIGWVKKAVKLGRVLIENKKYDAIISSSPPMSAHLIGKRLADEFEIPWIADFRDYWTSYKPEDWFENQKKIDKANSLIEEIKYYSSKITSASLGISSYLEEGEVIYNGFDEIRAGLWQPPDDSSTLNIGVLGTIDKLTPIKPLFELLSKLFSVKPELKSKVKIIHVGAIKSETLHEQVKSFNLGNIFQSFGVKPRVETIELLNNSHLFYFGLSKEFGEGIITSRLFDIFASGRSILASVPNNFEAALLINATSNGCTFDETNVDGGAACLVDLFDKFTQNELSIKPLSDYAEPFSANKMTEKFVAILNDVTTKTTE